MSTFLIETFNKSTGKRYHYSHENSKVDAIRHFLSLPTDLFNELGAENQIICLIEQVSQRAGMFNEGVGTMGVVKIIAVKGLNVPPSKLSVMSISESVGGNPNHFEPSIYLRQIA